ncbi:MAG: sodium:calcium antiporter [Acidobacteriota bacterium]|nr:MAG: sodium:calcium antiporter [Acidobacteriota bacterium]
MDFEHLLTSLALITFASVVIMFASETFESASSYLGRNMAAGIKGATINAAGSSMPELLTTAVFLFVYEDLDGFSAGVATAAGSAVFNGLIIPALCIFVVVIWGTKKNGVEAKVKYIEVDSRNVLRDGIWLVIGEIMLIVFLGNTTLTWVAGALLLTCYVGYLLHLMYHNRKYRDAPNEDIEGFEAEEESPEKTSKLRALLTFDFNNLFFNAKPYTTGSAWTVLGAAIVVLGAACLLLAEAVIESATALNIPTFFTAVVLAAAATSVPDTVLSVKDARNGLYDDAVSNALGSNIFDIAVSLGLPLFVYSLLYGEVSLSHVAGESAAQVQVLRIVLLWVTVAVISILLIGKKAGIGKATIMLLIYGAWMTWIADSAFNLGIFPT